MNKQKKILILDDTHGHYLFRNLNKSLTNCSFPETGNVISPMKWYKYIIKNKPDYIIMGTWYKAGAYDSAKGITLLERLVSHYGKDVVTSSSFLGFSYKSKTEFKMSGFNSKIIYICDMGHLNRKKFSIMKYFEDIIFVPNKSISTITKIITN